jgi:hypothetical protein
LKTTRQFRVFLLLTAILALGLVAWAWARWRIEAPQREAWASIQADLGAQSARIDSLKQVLDRMQRELDAAKGVVVSAGERLEHARRQAEGGRLQQTDHRRYLLEIERHNRAVDAHNARLGELRRVHAEYSALVDLHNALVDSANELQRRAIQKGIQLAEPQ